jgi:hypothetical protein
MSIMEWQFKVTAVRLVSPDKGNKSRPVFVEKTAERIPQGVVKCIAPDGTFPQPAVYLVPQV